VALTAGIVEEIIYRGVMIALWQRILGSWWAAMMVCVAVFSLVHFLQGWRAMAAIALTAMAAHLIVRATGDLYTAMTVHFVYDLIAGVVLLRCARRDRVLPMDASR
jgi:membrane protease YdiL (CAAX protease family)